MKSLFIALLLLVHSGLIAESITRGPYLQQATPTSVVVRWRTDASVVGRVRFGTVLGSPSGTATEGAATTEHSVNLTGLTAGTTYYYDVGNTTTVLVSGSSYMFKATPTSSTAPVRVWVLGDCGTKVAGQIAVRDAYYAWNGGSKRSDVTLLLGDNAYDTGTDAEYQAAIFDVYPESLRQGVFWSTIGNHDTAQAIDPALTIPYFQIFTNPTAGEAGGVSSGTEKYYSFDHGPIHFVCLDSMTSSRSSTGAMATWLKSDLAATTKTWIIAFWHHPPYTKGSHDSDTEAQLAEMRQVFVPIMEDYGVDLVLSGHSHSYERSYLIDGHYGTSSTFTSAMKLNAGDGKIGSGGAYTKTAAAHQGAVYAVPGSAGKISGGTLNHPAMVVSLNELASMAFDVSGDRLDAVAIRSDGVIRDSFTIIKQASSLPSVTITATDGIAGETLNPAVFTVSRSGPTTASLTVNIDWTGTASRNADYTAAASVVIPIGSASATVALNTIDDALAEVEESAVATIAANAAYTVGSPGSATATIADNDSTTVTASIAASSDDAEENLSGGAVDIISTDLELIRDIPGAKDQLVGMRFSGVTIPMNAVIVSASIQFVVDEATSAATALTFKAQAIDNAPTFSTTTGDISARTLGTAAVSWSPAAWSTIGSSGSEALTPELKTVVQEVVSRPGWTSGNALAIIVSGSGSRVANSKDLVGGIPAQLRIVWAAAANQAPAISAATATPNPVTASTTSLSATATDDAGEAALTYTWSSVSVPSGATATFSPNGNNAAKASTSTFTRAGAYTLRVTATDAGGLTATRDVAVTVNQTATSMVVSPASTSVATAGTATFTATVSDQFGQVLATQPATTWSVSGGGTMSSGGVFTAGATVGGPWTVTATGGSVSGTAQVSVVASGTTTTDVSIAASADDAEENISGGAVDLISTDLELVRDIPGAKDQLVGMRFAGIAIPKNAVIAQASIQFAVDEATSATTSLTFRAQAIDNAPAFTTTTNDISARALGPASVNWSPAAWATIGSTGSEALTPELKSLVQEVISRSGWASGNALVIVVSGSGSRVANSKDLVGGIAPRLRIVWSPPPANQAPSVSAATASPNPVTGTTATLSATATDDAGEPALSYSWSAVTVPASGGATFSPNGSNAAKASTATFTRAGSYTLRVTATDGGGLTATRDVVVTVNQTATSLTVSPASTSVAVSGTVPFTRTVKDQFGQTLATQPATTWTVSGGGTISSGGVFTAGTTPGGPWTVTATAGSVSGTAQVSVTGTALPTVRINFQPATAPTFAGYLVDAGDVYGNRGNGQTYGWVGSANNNTRDRNATALDQRYDTLNHLQKSGNTTWELALPNGDYDVTMVCGDPSFFDGIFKVQAEGVLVVNGTPTTSNRWISGTATVSVLDGKLTVTPATGATNAKICFIDVVPTPVIPKMNF